MNTIETYTVFNVDDDSADVKVNLSAQDVIRHIYRHNNSDYRLNPMMCSDAPEIQQTVDGDLLYKISFNNSDASLWDGGGYCIVSGKTEAEAEASYLQRSFDCRMWDHSYWTVLSQGYLKEIMDRYTTAIAIAQQD